MPKSSAKNIKRQEYFKVPTELELRVHLAINTGKVSRRTIYRALGTNPIYLTYYLRKPDNLRLWQLQFICKFLDIDILEGLRLGSERCTDLTRLRQWAEERAVSYFTKEAKCGKKVKKSRVRVRQLAVNNYLQLALAA